MEHIEEPFPERHRSAARTLAMLKDYAKWIPNADHASPACIAPHWLSDS